MNYTGTWLFIKSPDNYGPPHFMKFEGDKRVYYRIANITGSELCLERELYFPQPPLKVEEVDEHRLRFHTKGVKASFYGDGSTVNADIVLTQDYQKLLPTRTTLTEEEITRNSYQLEWGKEKLLVKFNVDLEKGYIAEMNKRLGREGRKIILERFEETIFLAFYDNGQRDTLMPIKTIDENYIVLYGFSKEPYEVTGYLSL